KPQPDEKPLGETLKDLFAKPVMPEMTDVHLPLNLNIESFRGDTTPFNGRIFVLRDFSNSGATTTELNHPVAESRRFSSAKS
ncbi:hypothetical protein KU617_23760, partial [Salmonella enterica subsp. enterica serovar Montevideo]|nr:hypothetical protein [Salmonella enterica subsp. enterica serovar Montevideo]